MHNIWTFRHDYGKKGQWAWSGADSGFQAGGGDDILCTMNEGVAKNEQASLYSLAI